MRYMQRCGICNPEAGDLDTPDHSFVDWRCSLALVCWCRSGRTAPIIDYTPAINQYYEAIQYQDASAAEISTWNGLLNGSTTVAEMQTAIINDPYTLNVVDPVIREYQAALGRIPDEAGITYWVGQVATNPAELGTLSVTFANSTNTLTTIGRPPALRPTRRWSPTSI